MLHALLHTKKGETETIFRHAKAESIHHQQTGIKRNVNRSPSVKKENDTGWKCGGKAN